MAREGEISMRDDGELVLVVGVWLDAGHESCSRPMLRGVEFAAIPAR